jgi:polyisoprenoid-binding protein YceI
MRRVVILILGSWLAATAQTRTYEIVAAQSRLTVSVSKAGLLSGLGHNHTIAVRNFGGRVTVPPDGAAQAGLDLEIEAKSLAVADEGIDEKERAEIQQAMETAVLEVARFPKITFKSTSVSELKAERFVLNGDLTLHGVTKRVAVPVTAQITPAEVRATGRVAVRQTDFGIKPYTAGLGTIKVKNELELSFSILAASRSR